MLSNISFLSPCVKQFVVLTIFKSLLILDHILGPRNDIFFCPKAVFRRGISNAICVLYSIISIQRGCKYIVEIGWCQLIPIFINRSCSTKFYS